MTVPIDVGTRHGSPGVHKTVHITKTTVIPPHSTQPVPIHHFGDMPKDRDYLFEPADVNFGLYAHLINADTSAVVAHNDSDKSIHIPRNFRLGHVTEMDYPNVCHAVSEDIEELALRRPKKEHKTSWFKKLLVACAAATAAATNLVSPTATANQAIAMLNTETPTLPIPGVD